jgi:hypothetical protein
MSDASTFLDANQRNWDERVPIHRRDRTGFYAIERFLREGSRCTRWRAASLVISPAGG